MKKLIVNPENPNGILVDLTKEEIAQIENMEIQQQAEQQAKAKKDLDAFEGNAKLLSLGLTQAQITAMTGYTPPAEV